jgi:hypothetical protein
MPESALSFPMPSAGAHRANSIDIIKINGVHESRHLKES